MTEALQVYRCEVCGNMVEVLHGGAGAMTCCNRAMTLQGENTTDAAREKHVPVVERLGDSVKVTVGSVAHPMEEKHYIEWIELLADGKIFRKILKPGEEPVAVFEGVRAESPVARGYCNLHGLWKNE